MTSTGKPLRTAIIGLSASATTSWASGAHLPALLSPSARELYDITALCNSSVSAAKNAIDYYKLPSTTKAYGDPESLAADPDIDVVICSTRVDKHLETVLPSVKAGKKVFVEWPIAANINEGETLLQAAQASGSKVALMLQGRWAPPVVKLREVIESGQWGKLLSVEARAYGGAMDRASFPPGLAYFADSKVGGNPITIGFGHLIDFIQSAVGELQLSRTQAQMQIQHPKVLIRHSQIDPSAKDEYVSKDVPDLVAVHGALPETAHVAKNATLAAFYRVGQPFKGEAPLTWSLNFERGEVRLTSPGGVMLQANVYDDPPRIEAHDFATDSLKEIPWDWNEEQKALPNSARGVHSCLVAFAQGSESGYVSLEDALRRTKQIQSWWNSQ